MVKTFELSVVGSSLGDVSTLGFSIPHFGIEFRGNDRPLTFMEPDLKALKKHFNIFIFVDWSKDKTEAQPNGFVSVSKRDIIRVVKSDSSDTTAYVLKGTYPIQDGRRGAPSEQTIDILFHSTRIDPNEGTLLEDLEYPLPSREPMIEKEQQFLSGMLGIFHRYEHTKPYMKSIGGLQYLGTPAGHVIYTNHILNHLSHPTVFRFTFGDGEVNIEGDREIQLFAEWFKIQYEGAVFRQADQPRRTPFDKPSYRLHTIMCYIITIFSSSSMYTYDGIYERDPETGQVRMKSPSDHPGILSENFEGDCEDYTASCAFIKTMMGILASLFDEDGDDDEILGIPRNSEMVEVLRLSRSYIGVSCTCGASNAVYTDESGNKFNLAEDPAISDEEKFEKVAAHQYFCCLPFDFFNEIAGGVLVRPEEFQLHEGALGPDAPILHCEGTSWVHPIVRDPSNMKTRRVRTTGILSGSGSFSDIEMVVNNSLGSFYLFSIQLINSDTLCFYKNPSLVDAFCVTNSSSPTLGIRWKEFQSDPSSYRLKTAQTSTWNLWESIAERNRDANVPYNRVPKLPRSLDVQEWTTDMIGDDMRRLKQYTPGMSTKVFGEYSHTLFINLSKYTEETTRKLKDALQRSTNKKCAVLFKVQPVVYNSLMKRDRYIVILKVYWHDS